MFVWLGDVMECFIALHNRRGFGMSGASPISLVDIDAYFRMFDIAKTEEKRYYLRMVGALDSLYLRLEAERQQREAKNRK